MKAVFTHYARFSNRVFLLVVLGAALAITSPIMAQPTTPPMYNDREGGIPACTYTANTGCTGGCDCVTTFQSVGWPCDNCDFPTANWPLFASTFYSHVHFDSCSSIDFHELALIDFDGPYEQGNTSLVPDHSITIKPIAHLGRIREVPLECSPERSPVEAAARYELELNNSPNGSAICDGAIFFVTAEFNPTLFDVTVYGDIRSGSTFPCGSTPLQPFQPRLVVGTKVFTNNDLRYPNLIASPDYVKVTMKPGRSTRDAGNESVKIRLHTFNWGSGSCNILGFNCQEGFRFQKNNSANVQVFSLELPTSWCQDAPPLSPDDALPISTLSDQQRQSAEFDGIGAKAINDLTAELPTMRVGHNRFRCGRSLEESLGNDAYWHTDFGCNAFVRIDQFGVWCAVDDLPGWTSAQVGSELVVTDPCEGLTYHYRNPDGSSNLNEVPLKLALVKRSGTTIRTYAYSGGGVAGNLTSQTDSSGHSISYGYTAQGSDTLLTVTGTQSGGGARVITALYSSDGLLKSATWSNGGPARQYEFIADPFDFSNFGRIKRVLDAGGNVLLEFKYDDSGRVLRTTRGSGGTFQVLNKQTYETPPGFGYLGDTWMVSQCFVDVTQYQATARRFDSFNRVVELREYHDLQTATVDDPFTGEPTFFSGSVSITTTIYRGPDDFPGTIDDISGSHFTVEKVLPGGTVAEYSVFDSNFNVIQTFTAIPGLFSVSGETLIHEKHFAHAQFGGVWQTTDEIDVARDNATTAMTYNATTGFLTGKTMPSISAANSGSGVAIPGYSETYSYDSVNKKRINTETRKDGQNNTINVTNTFDTFDNLASRVEVGGCDTETTLTSYIALGQQTSQTDADGFVTAKVFDEGGHPNNGSGLLLGQHTFASGSSGPVLQQTRYFYFTSGANRGRLEHIDIADHEGPFTLGSPSGWQVTTFAYDAYGRVSTKTTTHTVKSGTHIWTYAYDVQDRVKQIAFPDGMWVRTGRDGRGLTVNDFVGSGGTLTAGTGGTVVLTNTYEYDLDGMLVDRLNQSAADLPDHSTYGYDIYLRRTSRTDLDNAIVGYDIVTAYEYNDGMDVVRETIREGASGPLRSDIRRDSDELGRVWRERILANAGTLNDNADRITTTTFDVRGNEVATRVKDAAIGDALTVRAFTCFNHRDSATVTLNNTQTALTDYTTDRRGNVTVEVDPVLNRTEHDYDATSRPTQTRHYEHIGGGDVLQLREDMAYSSRGQLVRRTRYSPANAPFDQQRWESDSLGFQSRHARMADPASAAAVTTSIDRVVDMSHDGEGRELTHTAYDGGMARTTTRGYDNVGRLNAITHPVAGNSETLAYYANSTRLQTRTITDEIGSRVMTTVFDPFGRLRTETANAIAPAAAVTTTYEYDGANRRTRVTDPLGYLTISGYDGIGQLTSQVDDSGGANQRTTTFTFTQKGDPLTVVADDGEGPQTTTYQHDRAGRRTRATHPGGAFKQFAYDLASRVQTRTAEDNVITFYNYNWRSQVVQKRQTNSAGAILEDFSFDPLGRMTAAAVGAIATAQYKTTYVYGNGTDVDGDSTVDPAYTDEPAAEAQTVAGVAKTIRQRHNTAGERSRLVYPADAGTMLDYGYQAACGCSCEQVTRIDRNGNRLVNYEYAGKHVIKRQVRTVAGAGETWIELVWSRPDQLRRPAGIFNQIRTGSSGGVGGTVTPRMSYTNLFDAASNLDQQTTANHPITSENGLHDHGYDRLHRLTNSNYPNTTNDESWTLDRLGNWESHTDRSAVTQTYTDNTLNQYTAISGQVIAPLHDAKGNLVRNERGYGFTYDFENHLTRVFRDNAPANGVYDGGEAVYAEYVVDANGNSVQAAIAASGGALTTSYRYYDGSLVLAEYLASSPTLPSAVYVHGPTYLDEHILIRDGGGNEGYYLLKDLYTVAAIVDKDGNYQQAYSYTGYGLPTVVDFASVTCQPGDLDADSIVDIADLPQFIAVLLTGTGTPQELCASDLNGDGNRDGRDIQPMTNCILNAGSCPPPSGGGPSTVNPFFFTGQRLDAFDPTSGPGGNPDTAQLLVYDYKARVFDPKHGRFQQRDPLEFADAYNLYEYAASRPLVLTDPTGKQFMIEITLTTAIQNGLQGIQLPGLGAALVFAKNVAFVASAIATAVAIDAYIIRSSREEWKCRIIPRGVCPSNCQAPFEASGPSEATAEAAVRAACYAAGCNTPGGQPYNCQCGHVRCRRVR